MSDYLKIAAVIALMVAASSVEGPPEDEALCHTDSECSQLCSEADRQLPPDHPNYCDGGPS